jgi:hypothetical protein
MQRFEGLVVDASVWTGADLQRDQSWIIELTPDQAREIRAAVDAVRQMPIDKISRDMFRLPAWKATFDHIDRELEGGRGFVLMRGMPLDGLEMDDIKRLYWGFGIQLGEPVSQNKFGNLICHVRNEGARYGTQNSRGYNSNMALKVHNDSTDVVGLLCVRQAKSGGQSIICSATAIYNEFVKRRPDLLDQLYEGFHYHLRGEERPGHWGVTPHRIPTFSYVAGKLSCRYVRNAIQLVPERTGVPLTHRERETLDLFDEIATSPQVAYAMELRRGDLQLLNNYATVHTRTAFEDFEDPALVRHLMRLWLRTYNTRPLAPEFENRYGADYVRRGIPPTVEPQIPFPA